MLVRTTHSRFRPKGDLLISLRTGEQILVETTALGTAQEQILDDRVHTQLGAALTQIATNHAVLHQRHDPPTTGGGLAGGSGIEELLNRIAILAGQIRSTGQPQAELSVDVHLRVEPDSTGQGSWTLTGPEEANRTSGPGRRTAREKLIQSKGDRPVWLRIDSRDGMFTLTEWSKRDDILRLDDGTYLVPVLDDALTSPDSSTPRDPSSPPRALQPSNTAPDAGSPPRPWDASF